MDQSITEPEWWEGAAEVTEADGTVREATPTEAEQAAAVAGLAYHYDAEVAAHMIELDLDQACALLCDGFLVLDAGCVQFTIEEDR